MCMPSLLPLRLLDRASCMCSRVHVGTLLYARRSIAGAVNVARRMQGEGNARRGCGKGMCLTGSFVLLYLATYMHVDMTMTHVCIVN